MRLVLNLTKEHAVMINVWPVMGGDIHGTPHLFITTTVTSELPTRTERKGPSADLANLNQKEFEL